MANPEQSDLRTPKVALLGPIGVGKTSLSIRLGRGEFGASPSTHGIGAEPLVSDMEAGTLLIEGGMDGTLDFPPNLDALNQHEFSAALVLIDPTAGRFEQELTKTAAWVRQKRNTLPFKKSIIATRVDRGSQAEQASLESLAQMHGFDGLFSTSAKDGNGIQELRDAILSAVQWQRDQEPAVETEVEFVVRTLAENLCELIARNPQALDHIE